MWPPEGRKHPRTRTTQGAGTREKEKWVPPRCGTSLSEFLPGHRRVEFAPPPQQRHGVGLVRPCRSERPRGGVTAGLGAAVSFLASDPPSVCPFLHAYSSDDSTHIHSGALRLTVVLYGREQCWAPRGTSGNGGCLTGCYHECTRLPSRLGVGCRPPWKSKIRV